MVAPMYVMKGTVTSIHQKTRVRHLSGAGKDAVMGTQYTGWYITLDNILSFCVGDERPEFEPGQKVQIIICDDVELTPPPIPAPGPTRNSADMVEQEAEEARGNL